MVLGRAIIWACFGPLTSSHVPQDIADRVKSQYAHVCTFEPILVPIRKVCLVVCGREGQIFIDNLIVDVEDDTVCSNDETSRATSSGVTDLNKKRQRQSAEQQVVISQLSVPQKQNEVLSEEIDKCNEDTSKQKLKYMTNTTLNRIAAIPAQITRLTNLTSTNLPSSSSPTNVNSTGTDVQGGHRRAKLCHNPKSLYVLWNECKFGVHFRLLIMLIRQIILRDEDSKKSANHSNLCSFFNHTFFLSMY